MSFFDKWFGKNKRNESQAKAKPSDADAKPSSPIKPSPAPLAPVAGPSARTPAAVSTPAPARSQAELEADPNLIEVYDSYGRRIFISRQEWREKILPEQFKTLWDKPDELYTILFESLNDDLGEDLLAPARHLREIDPNRERGTVLLAAVCLETQRFDEAEQVLEAHLRELGETGYVLTNLAKVYSSRGDKPRALATVWRALELDPNQENALGWYVTDQKENAGEAAALEALRRIAALPGSWRARLWLARDALMKRDVAEALALYQEALDLAPRPLPSALLASMSGDLGNQGHLPEILNLVSPHFDVAAHGLAVGNNLLKANLDLGRLDAVQSLLDAHYALKRPDWNPTLHFWSTELAKARLSLAPAAPASNQITVAVHPIEGPLWLPANSPASELFPAPGGEALKIAFLGSSAEIAQAPDTARHMLSDNPGRVSRALPLFLAEQVHFAGSALVRTLIPRIQGEMPAFVLISAGWSDEQALQHARMGNTPADFIVVSHLNARNDPWQAQVRLLRTIDGRRLGTLEATINLQNPEAALRQLSEDLLTLLAQEANLERNEQPALYQVPAGPSFALYLLRLEQCLAVRCSALEQDKGHSLSGEHEIIDGTLQLCLAAPTNPVPRLLLAKSSQGLKLIRPQVVETFRERIQLLQTEKPLPAPADAITARLFAELFT